MGNLHSNLFQRHLWPFWFLCLPVFLQKLKSSNCMSEGQYSPPWAQGHPALTPLLEAHSNQRRIPQNIFFHSIKLWRQMLLKASKGEMKWLSGKFRVKEEYRQHRLEPLLRGASPIWQATVPETMDTENGAFCTREGLPASSFWMTQARFCSFSSWSFT